MMQHVMAPSYLFVRLAVQHVGHRPVRTALLALAVAVGGSAVFVASALRHGIQDVGERCDATEHLFDRTDNCYVYLRPQKVSEDEVRK
jgi:hypothetical protein